MKEEFSFKKFWKKFWFLLWKDDSMKGWLFSVVFLFVFITFIFFPLLRLSTGTALPLAIVESCSMYHSGDLLSNFDQWWTRHDEKYSNLNISKNEFSTFSLKDGFNKGDILLIIKANPDKLKVGDVIIFNSNTGRKNPIIHRIINITEKNGEKIFSTEGDNNQGQLEFEKKIYESQLVGKATPIKVPLFGWVKLIFFESQKSPYERGFCSEN